MKNISFFLSENVPFLEVKFSVYLNRHVFVMLKAASQLCTRGKRHEHIRWKRFKGQRLVML